jgi:hypothetical protein
MVNAVVYAGLAAFYSSNDSAVAERHINYGAKVLRAWFIDNSTKMLPNLYYGQIQPHKTPPQKSHGGFIEWAHTAMFLDHVALLRYAAAEQASVSWTAADDAALMDWWQEFQAYMESGPAQGERKMPNNHGSWYDADWLAVTLFNGDAATATTAAKEVLDKRISLQIKPNGSEWIELERNVPSGYCQYNLMALSQCADLAASGGAVDVWGFKTAGGASLIKSIDWLLPYATG